MSEPKRSDLRIRYGPTEATVRMNRDGQYEIDVPPQGHRKATDAGLAAMGYYKLEGIDVERLREDYQLGDWYGMADAQAVIVQVLAALDGETL